MTMTVQIPRSPADRVDIAVALACLAVGLAGVLGVVGLPDPDPDLDPAMATLLGYAALLSKIAVAVGVYAAFSMVPMFPRLSRLVEACLKWPIRIAVVAVAFLLGTGMALAFSSLLVTSVIGWAHGMGVPMRFLPSSELPPTAVFAWFAIGISLTALTYYRAPLEAPDRDIDPDAAFRDRVFIAGLAGVLLLVAPGAVVGTVVLDRGGVLHRIQGDPGPANPSPPGA